MKIARFEKDGRISAGIVDSDAGNIYPFDPSLDDITDLIRITSSGIGIVAPMAPSVPIADVRLVAPIIPSRNVFCVGKNYHAHAREFSQSGFEAGAVKGKEVDDFPAIFTKPPSTIIGPGDQVELHPAATQSVDYEAELAVVIGRPGRNIAESDAMTHVWGYTIVNDVTARDRQKNHKQWFAGKALDTFCPMGPWIVTADELAADNIDIECRVNGELRQSANTRDLIFSIPQLIASISAGLTLQAGDVIATGTPAGVGIGFNPPKFLKAGDEVEITASGIGTLRNSFG